MITDLDESIKKMVMGEIPIKNGEVDVRFDQPTREWSAKLNKPTINFFLFDVRENVTLRQHQWEQLTQSRNGNHNVAHLKRTPFRIDCHYILTTWVPQGRVDDEHRLLTLCLLALLRNPTMPESCFHGQMQRQSFDIPCRVAGHDKLTNTAEIWSALDNEIRPTVSYLVTIALDPWQTQAEDLVRSFILRLGATPDGQIETIVDQASEKSYIGGRVTIKGEPQSGVRVAIKDTGFMTLTDDNGRYRLGSLKVGDYTLIVWPEHGDPREHIVSIPQRSFDIAL